MESCTQKNSGTIDFFNHEYLAVGNKKQRRAYEVLQELQIFNSLKKYTPVLVGTIPIDIDIESSDLDIICEVYDFELFQTEAQKHFSHCLDYCVKLKEVNRVPRMVINFTYGGFLFELFAQPIPVNKQNGYRHMVIEHRLLMLGGLHVRDEIVKLKKMGYKTEPAFAHYFQFEGDPYETLLQLGELRDEELLQLITKHHNDCHTDGSK